LPRHAAQPIPDQGKEAIPSMTVEPAIFTCSICGEPSSDICVYCTMDACRNHRCDRCKRCSDCCECEVPLSAEEAHPEPPHTVAVEPEQVIAAAPLPIESEPLDEAPISYPDENP